MNKQAIHTAALFLILGTVASAARAEAADTNVKVTVPDFVVKLNGHTVENAYREFPLLVYPNVTYFPMTWYDSRLLGLESNWAEGAGLTIKQSQVASSYEPYQTGSRNQSPGIRDPHLR